MRMETIHRHTKQVRQGCNPIWGAEEVCISASRIVNGNPLTSTFCLYAQYNHYPEAYVHFIALYLSISGSCIPLLQREQSQKIRIKTRILKYISIYKCVYTRTISICCFFYSMYRSKISNHIFRGGENCIVSFVFITFIILSYLSSICLLLPVRKARGRLPVILQLRESELQLSLTYSQLTHNLIHLTQKNLFTPYYIFPGHLLLMGRKTSLSFN